MMNNILFSKHTLIVGVLMSLMPVLGTSCSEDEQQETATVDWNVSGNEIVSFKPERYKIQKENPMQGWVIYAGIGDGMMDNFWELYDDFESAEGKVKVSDYGTTLYMRGAWSQFNPEEGKYIWQDDVDTAPARRFRMLMKGAKERGLKIAWTFVTDSRDKHENFSPEYVREAGAKYFETTTGSFKGWTPYPDDPIFQEKYGKFLRDFAAKYDDPEITQFVSGFGLGKWGETHTLVYSTGDASPREAVFEWITDLMVDAFKRVPIMINYHRCLLNTNETADNGMEKSEELIDRAVKKGFCLRHDAFGMKNYYKAWERGIAAKYRYQTPFVMEGGWVESSHGNSIKGDGYNNFAEVRQGEFNEGKGANVNMMDLRFSSNVNTGETHSWFNTAFNLVKEFIAEGGYRLYADKISVPTSANSGRKVSIVHRWSNLGWGYCPTNIPQWNQKYKVCFALLDAQEKPVYQFVDDNPKINEWVKGTPHTYKTDITLNNVAAGKYTWAVGLVDTQKDNEIGIRISARDEVLTSDGWMKIADVTVK
jgi:hypothetical protein